MERLGPSDHTIRLKVNGEERLIPEESTVPDLLRILGLPPQAVLVEQNGEALFRDEWPGCRLAEGDRLEIIRIVAGG